MGLLKYIWVHIFLRGPPKKFSFPAGFGKKKCGSFVARGLRLTAPEDSYPPRLWLRIVGVHSPPQHFNYPSCGQQVMRPMVLCKLQLLVEARSLTTAREARRRAHSWERQHGALQIPGNDGTARTAPCAHLSALLSGNSTARTAPCGHSRV